MVLLTSLDNQNLLRGLEIVVVVLIWLFFLRVIRAVWVEVKPPKSRRQAASPEDADVSKRGRGRPLHLKIVEPEPESGRVYDLADELTLGRAGGCGVRVDDAYTSSIHARLYRQNGTLWVEDLDSTNGTWVNAQRIYSPTKLGKGDLLQVGGTVFEVDR